MPATSRISPAVSRQLGYYVYLYVNPIDESVFYVGKGRGNRAVAHLKAAPDKEIAKKIHEIRKAGGEPRIEILSHGLKDERAALQVEAAAIDLLGLTNLANAVRGHGVKFGRLRLDDAVAYYTRAPAKIREPAILIRINRLYRYGMSDQELYDATRSAWKVGERADKAQIALAIYNGVIREVYEITGWLPAGTTFNSRTDGRRGEREGRWEFVGVVAEEPIRRRYVNKFVGEQFRQGNRNPISYMNLD